MCGGERLGGYSQYRCADLPDLSAQGWSSGPGGALRQGRSPLPNLNGSSIRDFNSLPLRDFELNPRPVPFWPVSINHGAPLRKIPRLEIGLISEPGDKPIGVSRHTPGAIVAMPKPAKR
jgi:hypothetical protein